MNNMVKPLPARIMLTAFAGGALLHVDRAPYWCLGVALAAVIWHFLHSQGRLRLPPKSLRIILTLALFAGIAASFQTVSGLPAGTALLLVMGSAKLLETRSQRDAAVVATVSLVLVLAACLDRQSLLRLPLYLACGWAALATIAALGGARAATSATRAFGTAGRTLLLALPMAALCFVLVPRMQGALWSMPASEQAQTGLADEMSPGSISELAVSEDIAFRASFEGAAPPPAQRYWRGPVLHDFDGYTWRRQTGVGAPLQEAVPLSAPLRYHVLLEPTGRAYLFGIDSIASIEGRRNFRAFDGQVLASRAVTEAVAYDGVSYLQTRFEGELSTTGRRLDTRLPAGRNLRSIALARELRARATSDRQYATMVLDYFRDAGFEYTLTPPLLDKDSVDDLIFNTRLGFCGHFASAYATMMRAAGVPARVVTGYLGGNWNPIGGYYAIRQSQAHAWTEIWIDGEGWVRIDPTAVVAPERLQQGGSELLARSGSAFDSLFGDATWLRDLRDAWDAASNWWQERVVKFNRGAQLALLKRLGLDDIDYPGMVMLLAGGVILWGLVLWGIAARQPRHTAPDALARTWNRFIALLAARGIAIAAHDGPRAIAARAAARLPAAAAEITDFTRRYEQLRFGTAEQDDTAIRAMRNQLRQIARATAAGNRPGSAPVPGAS
jgi:transglutaminase-like putative cysteine protease